MTDNNINKHYAFSKSRSGETVPALRLPQGEQPLHSMVDPVREAQRLVSTITEETGFLIFLGLGGGFIPEAALEKPYTRALVIDFNREGIAELFANRDYSKLLENERFNILIDPPGEEIKSFILEQYKPALHGGIKTIPLRTRTEHDKSLFDSAAQAIHEAIDTVSGDYTVQAHFGKRWFSNIIRNIKSEIKNKIAEIKNEAAIAAAGPSLDTQMPIIAEYKKRGVFIISTDTAFPALAHNKIDPDLIVSIDCQHISCYHFLNYTSEQKNNSGIPLILDIASPPMLSRLPGFSPVFYSGGHPLAVYISHTWRHFPYLDTSGGNVTYACLCAAESLGAKKITFFGADFSYINSQSYARGTYIYPHFEKRQTRLSPLESQFSRFLYRGNFLPNDSEQRNENKKYYETSSLRFYRKKLEEKISVMRAEIIFAKGFGAPVSINKKQSADNKKQLTENKEKADNQSGIKFLERYCSDIAGLPLANEKENYFKKLNVKQKHVFTTLLPFMAAVKKQKPELKLKDLIEEVKINCIKEIKCVLSSGN